jgi:hypothetical protein
VTVDQATERAALAVFNACYGAPVTMAVVRSALASLPDQGRGESTARRGVLDCGSRVSKRWGCGVLLGASAGCTDHDRDFDFRPRRRG